MSAFEIVIAEVLNAAWRTVRINALEDKQLPAVARELPPINPVPDRTRFGA